MKKLGLLSNNKLFAESLAQSIKSRPNLDFEVFLLLKAKQVGIDAKLFALDVAIIVVLDSCGPEVESAMSASEDLRQNLPNCRILLLVSQTNNEGTKMAVEAIRSKRIDDFVFFDSSLDYLFSKLEAL